MTYTEAINTGKDVWRTDWGYWFFVSNNDGRLVMNDPLNGAPEMTRQWYYEPSEDDMAATDWEVVTNRRKWR